MHKRALIFNKISMKTTRVDIGHVFNKVSVIVILLAITSIACDSKGHSYFYLFDPQDIAYVVGSEFDDIDRKDSYKQISFFYVDYNNNLYVGDLRGNKIDKYNKYGNYVVSFGKAGQGPGEFAFGVPMFCADSRGFVFTSFKDYINVYNNQGEYVDKILYSEEMKNRYCVMIKADHSDNLILSLLSTNNEFKLVKYNRSTNKYITIHNETQRAGSYNNALCRFIPGFDVDQQDNIFILDTVRYKVFIYNPNGVLVKTFQKNIRRKKMSEKELYFSFGNHIINKFPDNYFNQLRGNAKYYPVLCGINIDNNQIYLWRTDQDSEHKHNLDIYDDHFRLIGVSSYYNVVYFNLVYIRNNYVYFLNIGDEDISFKNKLGILGGYNIPNKVICYKYSE